MSTMPTYQYGRGEDLQSRMGIDVLLSEKIAAIVVFSANIENHLERAIWQLRGGVEKGVRPDTDAKPITELIDMMSRIAASAAPSDRRTMLETWCAAARSGFVVRNNIVHGQTVRLETTVAFMRNTLWGGIERKRPFGDLWADHSTLDMVRDSFAVLLRIIWAVANGGDDLAANALAVNRRGRLTPISGRSASKNDPLSLRL